jgi:murein hydrolase activator
MGSKKQILRIIFSLRYFAVLFIFMIPGILSIAQESKEKLQKSKKQLEEEIKYTNTLLEQTQKNKQSSLNKLVILSKQIDKRQSLIETITSEVDQIQSQVDQQSQQIGKLSGEIKKMKEEYARMIYYAYKNLNSYNRLLFIFSAQDFNQAYRRLIYYQQYSAYRRTQAELIRAAQMDMTSKQRVLEDTKRSKMVLVLTKEQEKARLTQEKEDKDKSVKELSRKEQKLRATLNEKKITAEKLQKEIERQIAAEIRASTDRAKKTDKKDRSTRMETTRSEIMLSPVEMELSNSFAANKGRLPWPSERGIITGTFGEHPHPVLKYVKVKNNGIDISTEKNSLIRTVFKGKVSRVMSFQNLNKVVIIRHGEYLTVYSNLEEVSVKDGQEVGTKQIIGRVHTNAEDEKTEVHFELWLGKAIQNPQEWLLGAY